MSLILLTALVLAGGPRPAPFSADRPAAFARPSPACECVACKCETCKCEHPSARPIIGAVPITHDVDGRVGAVAMTCYQTARALAVKEGRPLVVVIGDTPPSLATHARDNPVIYCAAADPSFPRRGLYRFDQGAKIGKPAGLWQTAAPGANAPRAGSPPKCANGRCRLAGN